MIITVCHSLHFEAALTSKTKPKSVAKHKKVTTDFNYYCYHLFTVN